jgi:hypothetical protein
MYINKNIGYEIISNDSNRNIWRHNGYYKPIWKNLIEFSIIDSSELYFKNNLQPFKFNPTHIGIH